MPVSSTMVPPAVVPFRRLMELTRGVRAASYVYPRVRVAGLVVSGNVKCAPIFISTLAKPCCSVPSCS